jgi:hypothetical protein
MAQRRQSFCSSANYPLVKHGKEVLELVSFGKVIEQNGDISSKPWSWLPEGI